MAGNASAPVTCLYGRTLAPQCRSKRRRAFTGGNGTELLFQIKASGYLLYEGFEAQRDKAGIDLTGGQAGFSDYLVDVKRLGAQAIVNRFFGVVQIEASCVE